MKAPAWKPLTTCSSHGCPHKLWDTKLDIFQAQTFSQVRKCCEKCGPLGCSAFNFCRLLSKSALVLRFSRDDVGCTAFGCMQFFPPPPLQLGKKILCRCFKRIECISFVPQTIRGIIAWVLSIELHQLFICMPEGGHSGSLRFFLCTSEKLTDKG